jgi:feruloyl esterase
VTTDTGHRGRGDDGLWAFDNLPAQVDFGYRAIHVATLAAKSIVSRYYAKDAQKAYFMSCSTGGYQGMVEAQRFPWDFDGIIAGAPDMDEADLTMREVWAQRSALDKAGKPILDEAAIGILHQGALDECDMDDGVKDGLIGNPVGCRFDPAKLLCKTGETRACLGAAQVEAAKRIYDGPPHTQERDVRGALPGSEIVWKFGTGTTYTDSLFKYMIYGMSPDWTSAGYDFERDYKRLGMAAIYTDTNPDLRRFKAAGGKLLVYQGGNDVVEMPTAIVDYYQTVEKVMGGQKPTQDFFRLFIIPGMNHCGGGVGATTIDYLSYLESWVEQNHAPDKMIGAHVSDAYLASLPEASRRVTVPLDPKIPLSFTRPMYPFPQFAKYASGDPNDAKSFRPAQQ